MTAERGWYPDPNDAHTMRFWTGTQWIGERVWDGAVWIERNDPEPVAPAAPVAPVAPVATTAAVPGLAAVATRFTMSRTAWFLFAGCAIAAIGTMLPWEQDTTALGTSVSAGPSSVPGGVAMLLALVGAVMWIAWPARDGALSKRRRVALTVVTACVVFFAVAKFSALGDAASTASKSSDDTSNLFGTGSINTGLQYHPGSGLLIYTAGAISICVGAVRAWFARAVAADDRP